MFEHDISESYAKTVEAPEAAVRAAAGRIDLVGPLVEALIASGVEENIATPCSDGLVWRFDAEGAGRLRIAWEVEVTPETEDTSLVSVTLHATASDDASRARLLESWPVCWTGSRHSPRMRQRIPSGLPPRRREEAEPRELR